MREKFYDFVNKFLIIFVVFWPLLFIVPMLHNSINTTTEIYTKSCKVTDKYEDKKSELNVSQSLLLKVPIVNTNTIYIVVVEHEKNSYEVEVDKDMYDEIAIGKLVECEIEFTHNECTQEENYKVSKVTQTNSSTQKPL